MFFPLTLSKCVVASAQHSEANRLYGMYHFGMDRNRRERENVVAYTSALVEGY